jgi:hypothetical protein
VRNRISNKLLNEPCSCCRQTAAPALRSPDGPADHAVFQFDGVTLMPIEGGKITCQVASYDGLGFRAS